MSSKRKHGTGSVWAYRGRFRGEVMIDGERYGCIKDTREDAHATLQAMIDFHKAKSPDLSMLITLRQWGEVWFQRREQDGVRGVARERSRWNRHILAAPFADRAIKSIDRADVVAWMRSLMHVEAADAVTSPVTGKTSLRATGRKLSTQTVKHCVTLLRLAMRDALEESRIRRNPVDGVKPPTRQDRSAPRRKAWTFLLRPEIELATSAEVAEPYRTIYTVSIFAGLRREEVWALRWSEVHLDGDQPRIDVLVSKSDKPREVPLLPAATEALRRWRSQRPAVGNAYVFPILAGKHRGEPHPETYDGRWRDYWTKSKATGARKRMPGWCRRAGIARHVRFHDLRHTCASHLVMGTLDPSLGPMTLVEVGKWLGHSGPSVTNRYAHLAPDALHGKVRRAREGREEGRGDAHPTAEKRGRKK